MNGEMCCPRCRARLALVDLQQTAHAGTVVSAPSTPHQLSLPGFGETLSAAPPGRSSSSQLAARVAAAVPDLFANGAAPRGGPTDPTPSETLATGEYELVPQTATLAELEAKLPRPPRIPGSVLPPPPKPARPRTVPPPMPTTVRKLDSALSAPPLAQFALPDVANEDPAAVAPVAARASVAPPPRRRWMTYASAGVAAAAALVLSVNLLPHVSESARSAPIAEVPRAEAAEVTSRPTLGSDVRGSKSLTPEPGEPPSTPTPSSEATSVPAVLTATERRAAEEIAPPAQSSQGSSKVDTKPADPAPASAHDPAAEAESEADPASPDDDGAEFDKEAAASALDEAIRDLSTCKQGDVGAGTTRIAVTFASTGRVTTAILEGPQPFAGTPVAGCIVSRLRRIHVPPFSGDNVTVHRGITLP